MPFTTVKEMEKSFPGIMKMTPKQKKKVLEMFNAMKNSGMEDGKAIAIAMDKVKKMKMSEKDGIRVMSFQEVQISDQALEETDFEILRTGDFYDPRYGKFSIDAGLLHRLKDNFDSKILGIDVAVDINHDAEGGAKAWIKELSVKNDRLYMKIKDVTEQGKQFLKEKIYKYFSVEFRPFNKVEDGKKVTIKDVLRGVALTNRPVIKGMAPTFLSESVNNSVNNNFMPNFILELADHLKSKGNVSTDDAVFLRARFEEMPEDEQTEEVEGKVEEVEAEAATVEAEAAKAAEDAAKAESDAAEKAKSEAKVRGNAEEMKAAEVRATEAEAKYAEATKRIESLESERKEKTLSERVVGLTLSESNKKGFSAAISDDVKGFVASLSDEQFTQFSELLAKYNEVDLSEIGGGGAGKSMDSKFAGTNLPVNGEDVDAKIKALAEKEKLSYYDASIKFASIKS